MSTVWTRASIRVDAEQGGAQPSFNEGENHPNPQFHAKQRGNTDTRILATLYHARLVKKRAKILHVTGNCVLISGMGRQAGKLRHHLDK